MAVEEIAGQGIVALRDAGLCQPALRGGTLRFIREMIGFVGLVER